MSFNGSGTFLINTAGQPVVAGTVISSTAFNALTADLATGLSTVITKDGQTTVTANIPMSTYKFTGLGVGSAAGDSANLSQVQSTVTKLLTSVSGADTITAVGAPVVAAYAAGQMFYFVATGDNTGAVTLNIDALGAKAVTRDGSVALAAGDIKSGEVVVVVYDGTRFQVVSQLNSAGDATFANVSITSALNVGGVATFSAGTAAAPSITTTGDTNTGIFFPAADTIAFTEGGVEAARFDSSGNLGIGTSSWPSAQRLRVAGGDVGLEGQYLYLVNANADIQMGAAQNAKITNTDSTNTLAIARTGASSIITFSTAGSERARIDSSGNLGIGTTSPASKLDVTGAFGTSTTAFTILNNSGASASNIARIDFRVGNTFGGGERVAAVWGMNPNSGSNNGGALVFGVSANGTATTPLEVARFDQAGNLGIQTAGTSQTLGSAFQLGRVFSFAQDINSGYLGAGWFGTNSGTATYAVTGNYAVRQSFDSSAGTIKFFTAPTGTAGNTVSFTQAMTLTAAGELLVGTTGTDPIGGRYNGIVLGSGGSIDIRHATNTSDWGISASSGNIVNFYSDNGSASVFAGNISVNGSATAYNISSDYRLKDNIANAADSGDKVDAIKVRQFDWKETGNHVDYGFVAQELHEVAPHAVTKPEDDEKMWSVDYSKLVPMLVKEIQSLRVRVAQLESK